MQKSGVRRVGRGWQRANHQHGQAGTGAATWSVACELTKRAEEQAELWADPKPHLGQALNDMAACTPTPGLDDQVGQGQAFTFHCNPEEVTEDCGASTQKWKHLLPSLGQCLCGLCLCHHAVSWSVAFELT